MRNQAELLHEIRDCSRQIVELRRELRANDGRKGEDAENANYDASLRLQKLTVQRKALQSELNRPHLVVNNEIETEAQRLCPSQI